MFEVYHFAVRFSLSVFEVIRDTCVWSLGFSKCVLVAVGF